jgi:hypothetical protein
MATASRDNPQVLDESTVQYLPVATTSTIQIGDLLTYNTTDDVVELMDSTADALLYVGVAVSKYPTANVETSLGNQVKVAKRGVFEFNLNTTGTAYFPNDEFKWSTGGNTVVINATTSCGVGRLWKAVGTADSVVQLRIDKYVTF